MKIPFNIANRFMYLFTLLIVVLAACKGKPSISTEMPTVALTEEVISTAIPATSAPTRTNTPAPTDTIAPLTPTPTTTAAPTEITDTPAPIIQTTKLPLKLQMGEPPLLPFTLPLSGNVSFSTQFIAGSYRFELMDLQSLARQRIGFIGWQYFCPRLSTADQRMAFGQNMSGNWDVLTATFEGKELINLTKTTREDEDCAAWSLDGKKLAVSRKYSTSSDILSVNSDGSDLLNLTNVLDTMLASQNLFSAAPWSPDGSKIVFHSDRDGDMELYILNADGTDLLKITDNQGIDDFWAVWSPDGKKIAFVSGKSLATDIFVVEIDPLNGQMSTPVNVTKNTASDLYPAWSPDGLMLIFISDRSGSKEIYRMNSDGSDVHKLTEFCLDISESIWYP